MWLGGAIPFAEFTGSYRSQAQAVSGNRFPFDRRLKAPPSLHPCTLSCCVPMVTQDQDPLSHGGATVSPVCSRVLCHHLIFVWRASSGSEYGRSLSKTVWNCIPQLPPLRLRKDPGSNASPGSSEDLAKQGPLQPAASSSPTKLSAPCMMG